jgi:hypothetical protein
VFAASEKVRSIEPVAPAILALCLITADFAHGQRVILSEDFESDTPDTQPAGADFYARSVVTNPATDPSKIVVTGGAFADPFMAGNQSVVFHNPNSAAQMAITWTSAFEDDPTTFRNGVIEFDVWMEKPLPLPNQPGGKFWAFLDIRTGFGGVDRAAVSTVGDVTVWDNIRVQNVFGPPEPVESVVDAGAQFSVGLQTTYTDPVPGGLMAPDSAFHVRLEFSGTAGNESYVIKVNDTPITWFQDGEMSHPWAPGAPGINVLSFLSDASAFSSGGASNVYLDNLLVINNDLPPGGLDGDYNENGTVDATDYVVWRDNVGSNNMLPNDSIGGMIGPAHYEQWRANFGAALGAASVAHGVPEPMSLVLLVGGLTWAIYFQRFRPAFI